jgi:hypothetical protein
LMGPKNMCKKTRKKTPDGAWWGLETCARRQEKQAPDRAWWDLKICARRQEKQAPDRARWGRKPRNAKYPTPPPIELCPAPFLGLTVQPCGEPCGYVTGFDFLTVVAIWLEKKQILY